MTTFATALNDEIRRLARKEIRAETAKYAKAIAQYRREIARLKREQKEQDKKISHLSKQNGHSAGAGGDGDEQNDSLRFSSRSVRAQRRRTGLSAVEYAKLVGVSPLTIYNWEHGTTRPRQGQFARLVALRGLSKRQAHAKIAELKPKTPTRAARGRRRKPK